MPQRLTGSKSLDDVGFLPFFRVVSGDYGKPWNMIPIASHGTGMIYLHESPNKSTKDR